MKYLSTKVCNIKYTKRKLLGFLILGCSLADSPFNVVSAQDCTINAGGNQIICGSSTTLTGLLSGVAGSGDPTWQFVSGPTVPTIHSPNSYNTLVTGMTEEGSYTFQISQDCGSGTASSTVTITAHPRPASFTAGPDITNVCATTGSTVLSGVIPPGYTGEWRAVNIFSLERYSTQVATNSQFSNTTVANPTFELVNKSNHEIDPSYYVILKITSLDGICSYEDTAIVRFVPNSEIVLTNKSICRVPGSTQQFLDFSSTSPAFATNYPGSAGTVAHGTTVSLNVISQPAGANMTYSHIETRRIYFDGMTEDGTYTYKVTVSNACGTYTSPTFTYTIEGTSPHRASFLVSSEPSQWMLYNGLHSGGEFHCADKVGSTTPETFTFLIDPLDPPTVISAVSPSGIYPPGGAPTVSVSGAGTYQRVATVTPPAGGWQVGTYKFTVSIRNENGTCGVPQDYYIHISDGEREDVEISDVHVCYPGTGPVSATIELPEIYKGVVNSSYFQDYNPHYYFSVISKPAGSDDPTYTSTNLRNITSPTTQINNLTTPGEYVFRITLNQNNDVGPFYISEYECSDAKYVDTFTVFVEDVINSNAGSDQNVVCANSTLLAGNNPGLSTGTWTVVSAPLGAIPTFDDPNLYNTSVSNLSVEGTYVFRWTIDTGNCTSYDDVEITVSCPPCPPGTELAPIIN